MDDRHAYLKLGNNVARFDFDYLDLPTPTPGFLPRKYADGGMSFDPDTLEPRRPAFPTFEEEEDEESDDEAESTINQPPAAASGGAPIGHARKQGPFRGPENETARAGEKNRPAPSPDEHQLVRTTSLKSANRSWSPTDQLSWTVLRSS